MRSKISPQDLLLAHIYICHSLGFPAELRDAKVLKDIELQLDGNLNWLNSIETAAYVGHQIAKQRPFAYANKATAVALAMAIIGKDTQLKPDDVIYALEKSSVVDEVADQLILSGAR